jgi:hypothetical protein
MQVTTIHGSGLAACGAAAGGSTACSAIPNSSIGLTGSLGAALGRNGCGGALGQPWRPPSPQATQPLSLLIPPLAAGSGAPTLAKGAISPSRASPYLEAAAQAAACALAPLDPSRGGGSAGAGGRASWGLRGATAVSSANAAGGAAQGTAGPGRRVRWDYSSNSDQEPAFEAELAAWQERVDAGEFSLRPVSALSGLGGGPDGRAGPGPAALRPLSAAAAAAAATARPETFSSGALAAGGRGAARRPVAFSGGDAPALDALEALLLRCVVQKPRLTVLQLAAATQALRALDAAPQLAAAALLLRGGFWTAAAGLSYGGDWRLVGEVLGEMTSLLRAGLALGDDHQVGGCTRVYMCVCVGVCMCVGMYVCACMRACVRLWQAASTIYKRQTNA